MEPERETTNWLDIPMPPGKEDTMENTNSSFRPQRVEDPFQTNVSVINWSPGEATGATPDSSDPLSMLIEKATELVASKTDLTTMFKNSNLSAKTNDFIMDSDSAVQRVFRDVDIQQDNTDDSIPDLVTLIQAAVSDEIVELLNDTIVPELVSAMNRFVQARITSNGQALLGLLDKIDTSSGEQLIVMQDKSKLQRLNTLAKSIIDCRTQIDATTDELQIESGHCVDLSMNGASNPLTASKTMEDIKVCREKITKLTQQRKDLESLLKMIISDLVRRSFEYAARLPPERPTSTPTDLVLPNKMIGVPDAELPKKILDCLMDYCVQRPETTMVIVYVMSEIYRHLITDGRLVAPPSMHENAKGTMIGLTAEMGVLFQEQNVMLAEHINRTHPELIRRAKSKREYHYSTGSKVTLQGSRTDACTVLAYFMFLHAEKTAEEKQNIRSKIENCTGLFVKLQLFQVMDQLRPIMELAFRYNITVNLDLLLKPICRILMDRNPGFIELNKTYVLEIAPAKVENSLEVFDEFIGEIEYTANDLGCYNNTRNPLKASTIHNVESIANTSETCFGIEVPTSNPDLSPPADGTADLCGAKGCDQYVKAYASEKLKKERGKGLTQQTAPLCGKHYNEICEGAGKVTIEMKSGPKAKFESMHEMTNKNREANADKGKGKGKGRRGGKGGRSVNMTTAESETPAAIPDPASADNTQSKDDGLTTTEQITELKKIITLQRREIESNTIESGDSPAGGGRDRSARYSALVAKLREDVTKPST